MVAGLLLRHERSARAARHDYRAEIMGAVFNGAHASRQNRTIGRLRIATRRSVYAKLWHDPIRTSLHVPVLEARLSPAE